MSSEKMTIEHLYQPQERFVSIKLIKGQKDAYSWEIKAEGKTVVDALNLLKEANESLKEIYLKKEEVKQNG